MMGLGLSFILSFMFTLLMSKGVKNLLSTSNLRIKNYRQKDVINGGGFLLLTSSIFGALPLYFIISREDVLAFLLTIIAITFAGFMDDVLGKRSVKGFQGHLGSLMRGKLTTGAVKIIIAFFIGSILSLTYYRNGIQFIINILQFGLCVNLINLFDLRPGRAIKVFFLLSCLLAIRVGLWGVIVLAPIMGSLLAYIKDEMDENIMLGDTGSNLLGGILGFISVKHNTLLESSIFTIVLILLHLLSEFWSFTDIIKSSPFLMYIDNIGRMRREGPSND